ncbi:hypothetical protein T492DRAFT_1117676 [Pavlovales sp. CCMP2436]|nr:hypothetical protein T492DRAFT_1117676 [Pavlovales sp. CCMP2436]
MLTPYAALEADLAALGLSVRGDWLSASVSSARVGSSQAVVLEHVVVQLLAADLRTCAGRPSLPAFAESATKARLHGAFVLQLDDLVDVARKRDEREPNTPAGKHRLLMARLTDGFSAVSAIEYEPLRELSSSLPPGTKLLVVNPVVRRGLLLLAEENTTVLGGGVRALEALRDAAARGAGGGPGTGQPGAAPPQAGPVRTAPHIVPAYLPQHPCGASTALVVGGGAWPQPQRDAQQPFMAAQPPLQQQPPPQQQAWQPQPQLQPQPQPWAQSRLPAQPQPQLRPTPPQPHPQQQPPRPPQPQPWPVPVAQPPFQPLPRAQPPPPPRLPAAPAAYASPHAAAAAAGAWTAAAVHTPAPFVPFACAAAASACAPSFARPPAGALLLPASAGVGAGAAVGFHGLAPPGAALTPPPAQHCSPPPCLPGNPCAHSACASERADTGTTAAMVVGRARFSLGRKKPKPLTSLPAGLSSLPGLALSAGVSSGAAQAAGSSPPSPPFLLSPPSLPTEALSLSRSVPLSVPLSVLPLPLARADLQPGGREGGEGGKGREGGEPQRGAPATPLARPPLFPPSEAALSPLLPLSQSTSAPSLPYAPPTAAAALLSQLTLSPDLPLASCVLSPPAPLSPACWAGLADGSRFEVEVACMDIIEYAFDTVALSGEGGEEAAAGADCVERRYEFTGTLSLPLPPPAGAAPAAAGVCTTMSVRAQLSHPLTQRLLGLSARAMLERLEDAERRRAAKRHLRTVTESLRGATRPEARVGISAFLRQPRLAPVCPGGGAAPVNLRQSEDTADWARRSQLRPRGPTSQTFLA